MKRFQVPASHWLLERNYVACNQWQDTMCMPFHLVMPTWPSRISGLVIEKKIHFFTEPATGPADGAARRPARPTAGRVGDVGVG